MIGLNFADEGEANAFSRAINERLAVKQRRREGKSYIIFSGTVYNNSLPSV